MPDKMSMSELSYSPPVEQLLAYGQCHRAQVEQWSDYIGELQLSTEHIPDLIRMVMDQALWDSEAEDCSPWAPCHALRILGQFKSETAIEPLLNVCEKFDQIDWVREELPDIFNLIGPAAIPALANFLSDSAKDGGPKVTIAHCLAEMGNGHPESRDDCVKALIQTLEGFADLDDYVNGFIVSYLLDLNAVEAAPLIEQVYAEGPIYEMCAGSWPGVQVKLGLKSEADFSPEELKPKLPEKFAALGEMFRLIEDKLGPDQNILDVLLSGLKADPSKQLPDFKNASLASQQRSDSSSSQGFGQGKAVPSQKKKKKKKR